MSYECLPGSLLGFAAAILCVREISVRRDLLTFVNMPCCVHSLNRPTNYWTFLYDAC